MRKLVHNQRPYSALVCLVLLVIATCMGGDLYAQRTISTDVIASGPYGDVTIDAGVTFTVLSEVTITGNLNNNGGTIIVGEGGVLTVNGNVTNTTVDGTATTLSVIYETDNGSVTKGVYDSYTAGSGRTRAKTTITVNGSVGFITISSGGQMTVEEDLKNDGGIVTIESTNATKVSWLDVKGALTNKTSDKEKTIKTESYESNRVLFSGWSWSDASVSESSGCPTAINLSNGYLTVNNLVLEDGSTVSYKTDSELSMTLNGESVDVESTLRVKGDMTQTEDAVISLEYGTTGVLVVGGTYTDYTISEDRRPWKLIEGGIEIDDNFELYIQKYDISSQAAKIDALLTDLNNQLTSISGVSLDQYLAVIYPAQYETYRTGRYNRAQTYMQHYNNFARYFYEETKSGGQGLLDFFGGFVGYNGFDGFKNALEENQRNAIQSLQTVISANQSLKVLVLELQASLLMDGVESSKIDEKSSIISSLLPIELTYFSASENAGVVDFAWETSSEYNNDFYTIEYSRDGSSWSALLEEDGAGTTSDVSSYVASASAQQFSGLTYFRLKQTDFNGEYSYSDVTTVAFAEEQDYYVYPNPAEDVMTISGAFKSARIIDIHQRTVLVPTEAEVTVSGLPTGVYHVVLTTENGKKVIPFIKK